MGSHAVARTRRALVLGMVLTSAVVLTGCFAVAVSDDRPPQFTQVGTAWSDPEYQAFRFVAAATQPAATTCSAPQSANYLLYPDGCRTHYQGSGIAVVIPQECVSVLHAVIGYNWQGFFYGYPFVDHPKIEVTLRGSSGQVLATVSDANAFAEAHSAYYAPYADTGAHGVEAFVHAQYFTYDGPGILTSGWTSSDSSLLPTTIFSEETPHVPAQASYSATIRCATAFDTTTATFTRQTFATGPVKPALRGSPPDQDSVAVDARIGPPRG